MIKERKKRRRIKGDAIGHFFLAEDDHAVWLLPGPSSSIGIISPLPHFLVPEKHSYTICTKVVHKQTESLSQNAAAFQGNGFRPVVE